MNKSFFQKKKRIPLFLVPKMRKRHVPPIYKDHETAWKLFAEGALRNKIFHDAVINRGNKCLACSRSFITGKIKRFPHIEKHHHCYIRLCIGHILPEGSGDIYREAGNAEFPHVPDCRQCKANSPEYFEGCIKKSSLFTEAVTAIFMKWSKSCLTGSEQCFGITLYKPHQNRTANLIAMCFYHQDSELNS